MASIFFNIARICNSQLKCNYLKREKRFLHFLFLFWNLHQISNISKKKMMLIGNVFRKLQTVKNLVRQLCKKRRFGTCFDSQHVKLSQILAKSPWEHFCHIFSSFWEVLIYKMSPVLLRQILGLFLNTLAAEGKYLVQYGKNLELPIEMQLYQKRKTFSECFLPFMETTGSYILWISWLEHSLKSALSENPLTVNMWKRPKYFQNLHESSFMMFFIILREVDWENISHSVTWNRRCVC